MTTATESAPPKVWTVEDLLAMPDDGVERWVIDGKLREKPPEFKGVKVTVRNRHHSRIMSYVVTAITNWLRTQPPPRGEPYCGEVGILLPGKKSAVGVDVAFAPASVVAVQDDDTTTLLDGVPTLVVEILSPNDTVEQIHEKVREFARAGVPVVWVLDPEDRTVKVYRPGVEAESFNVTHRMPEHPALPGFAPGVAELFE